MCTLLRCAPQLPRHPVRRLLFHLAATTPFKGCVTIAVGVGVAALTATYADQPHSWFVVLEAVSCS
jgi:hypothetical protein